MKRILIAEKVHQKMIDALSDSSNTINYKLNLAKDISSRITILLLLEVQHILKQK